MGCLQSNFHGICNYYDEDEPDGSNYCYDVDDGSCICEDDPEPGCIGFESDSDDDEDYD